MNTEEMKAWIDKASYRELLYRWRFDPIGSPFFVGEVGRYFSAALVERKPSDAEHTAISKSIGWG